VGHVRLRRVRLKRVSHLVVDARQEAHKVERLVAELVEHPVQRLDEPRAVRRVTP